MRILAIYRHYWPDSTPYARLLRAILERGVAERHQASVFTAQPSYNDVSHEPQPAMEEIEGVKIRRLSLLPERKSWKVIRIINFAYFLVRSILHVLWHRDCDLIIANTHPPILMGVALRLLRVMTGIPYLLHAQDIHPESAVLANQLRPGWLTRWMQRIDSKSCSAAQCVVTLSEDMRRSFAERPGQLTDNIAIINNFPLDVYTEAETLPEVFNDSKSLKIKPAASAVNSSPVELQQSLFRLFFAGNIGHFQNLNGVIDAAHLLRDEENIQFIFMGAGAARVGLIERSGGLNGKTVFFEPFHPMETAFACMQRADLGIVSLSPQVYRVAYPSKTMTYLAAGCPLLALVEPESCLAQEIVSQNFGYVPKSMEPTDIAAAIRTAVAERSQWKSAAREKLILRSEATFGREQALNTWTQLLSRLEQCGDTWMNESEIDRSTREASRRAA